jgi:hypothetical protein
MQRYLLLTVLASFGGCSCTPPDPSQSNASAPSPKSNKRASADSPADLSPNRSPQTGAGRSDMESTKPPSGAKEIQALSPFNQSGNQSDLAKPKSVGAVSSGLAPAAAVAQANSLRATALRQESAGNPGNAFVSAMKAWELVRQHPDDARCAAIESELLTLLERLGEAADEQRSGTGRDVLTQRILIK